MTTATQRKSADRWAQRQIWLETLQGVAREAGDAGDEDLERSVVHLILRLKRSEDNDGI